MAKGKPFLEPTVYAFPAPPVRTALLLSLVDVLSRQNDGRPIQILEIGSWVGSSALTLAEGIKTFNGGKGHVFCCDYWEKAGEITYSDSTITIRNTPPFNNFSIFMYNIRVSGYYNLITPVMGDSRVSLAAMRDGHFDLVYVDGYHGHHVAASDIANGKRLLKEGGILCGDDLELQIDECDSQALHEQAEQDHGFDPRTGQHYHPGVTLAVSEALGPAKPFHSVWAFQKRGDAFVPLDISVLPRYIPTIFPEREAAQARQALGL